MGLLANRNRRPAAPPKISFVSQLKWDKGKYSRLDADRKPLEALGATENVVLQQDGTIAQRPGLKLYGTQPEGTVRGQIYEYVKMNGTTPETWNIWMEDRSGVGTVVTSKDGGAHTVVTGKTYDAEAEAHFEQIYGVVMITNGVDNLSYMNIATQTITLYTQLTTPTSVSATAETPLTTTPTGFIGLRYRAAAANQGETAASTASVATVNKPRASWNGTSEFVTITGTVASGTSRVNLYVGDQAGNEYFLDSIQVTGTSFTYVDNGSIIETTTRIAPVGDSTAGPKVTRCTNVKGQIYMVGDSDNPGRIWFGGNLGTSALDFSSFNGGGWVEPNKGGKDFPVAVRPFRDGKGTPMAVAFSKGTNGSGKRYLLQQASTTVGTTVLIYMAVQEDNGQDGTDSPDGVVMLNDAAWYPSRSAFKTSSTKANIQNIISTQGISDNIAPNVASLSAAYMDSCVGLAHDQCIYWALPYSSTTNNQIWVLDLRQKGAWMAPWYINADWMWLYADNSTGQTKFLMLVNNKFYEVDPTMNTNDDGTVFQTNVSSGDIKFNDDGTEFWSVIDVTFIFLGLQGNVNLGVSANTEDGRVTFSDTMTSGGSQLVSGHGAYGWGAIGWGNLMGGTGTLSVSTSPTRKQWTIPVDEECNLISWNFGTVDSGVSFQLAEVIIRGVSIGYKEIDNV